MSHDPNFMFCTFCANDTTRRDNLKFTHWLFDQKTRQPTCPFLMFTVCHICKEYGHNPSKCPNRMKLNDMHLATLTINTEKAKTAKFEYEKEVDRRLMIDAYINMPKHCTFCYNGNYGDDYYKTHFINTCPRLACMTCSYCASKGHTFKKCPIKLNEDLWKQSDPNDTRYILDFDAEM